MDFVSNCMGLVFEYLRVMLLLLLGVTLAASWIGGMVISGLENKHLNAFLCFMIPPYGICFAWYSIFKQERNLARLHG